MKFLKKIAPLFLIIFVILVASSCGGCKGHVDENKDGLCDSCREKLECSACVDIDPKDAKCDVCGKDVPCTECIDENGDFACDICGKEFPIERSLTLFDGESITFNIVLASDLSNNVRTYVQKNIIEVYRNFGITAKALTENSANDRVSDVEILIGGVENRGEEYYIPFSELGETGYEIKIVGSKVIINGGSADATLEALKLFTENILKPDAEDYSAVTITNRDEIRIVQTEFDVESITIGGTEINGGSIATDTAKEYYLNAAKQLQEVIYKKSGLWLTIKDLSATDAVIRITPIEKVYDNTSFTITAEDGILTIRCAFDNKLTGMMTQFVQTKFNSAKNSISLSGELVRTDISYVTYEDFGAIGDGVTDDADAIKAAHDYANISGQKVFGTFGKTYYIFNTHGSAIEIKTNVDWRGASFIIDDRAIVPTSSGAYSSLGDAHVFKVVRDKPTITADDDTRLALAEAGLGVDTKSIDLSILGVEGPVMIIPYNSGHKVFRRKGYGAWKGDSMHEVIIFDENGNLDPDTPIMFNYTKVTTLYIYPLDESTAVTVENGTFTTRVSQYNRYRSSSDSTGGSYINRGLSVIRSYTTVKNVKHYVTDELKLTDQVDENGNVIACGAIYHGFFNASNATNITFEDCVLTGRRCYPLNGGGADGTYDLSATLVNKIVYKNCTQSNFWVKVDDDFNIVPAKEGEPGAVLSMSSVKVNGKSLKMHWGIGGTNYCKNMEYIGSTLSRLDAHAGLYNGRIIDSTVNYISLVGVGEFTVENTRWFAEGTGAGSNSLLHLRSDYGSTWNGRVIIKDVDAYTHTSAKSYLVYHTYNNWYYGYRCVFPSLDIDGLEFYDLKTFEKLPEGYQIYLTGTSISTTTQKHLETTHTNPYFGTLDADKNGKIDEPLIDIDGDGFADTGLDLDGDGVVGNTSMDYTGVNNNGKKHTDTYVNLNIYAPPEYIKIKNNTAGIVYMIVNTSKNGISDGGYYDDIETYGGFLGDTKFYYNDEDYLLGSNHEGQTVTDTFKFY